MQFKPGRDSDTDDPHDGPLVSIRTKSNIDCLGTLRIRALSEELNVNKETVCKVLYAEMNMLQICAKVFTHNQNKFKNRSAKYFLSQIRSSERD